MEDQKQILTVKPHNGAVAADPAEEERHARTLAARYRCEFISLRNYKIGPRSVSLDPRGPDVPLSLCSSALDARHHGDRHGGPPAAS